MADENDNKKPRDSGKPRKDSAKADSAKTAAGAKGAKDSGKETKARWWQDRRKLLAAIGGLRGRRRRRDRDRLLAAEQRDDGRPERRRDRQVRRRRRAAAHRPHHQLAQLRLRPRPHPLLPDQQGPPALHAALEVRGQPAARVPADLRPRPRALREAPAQAEAPGLRGPPVLRQQQRRGVLAGRQLGQDHVEARDRRAERVLPRLLARAPVHHQPRARAGDRARREDRQDACGAARLPGRTESSPVVVGNKVFVGCECGELYALNAKTGGVKWSTAARR